MEAGRASGPDSFACPRKTLRWSGHTRLDPFSRLPTGTAFLN